MKRIVFAITLAAAAVALAAEAVAQDAPKPPESVKVTKVDSPRALKFEVVVPAKLDDVWDAFITNAGLNTWLWKECTVELKAGGGWTAHYPGGGSIVSFRPKHELVIHAMAPEKFPEVRRVGTTATFAFEAIGEKTRVTLTQTGWGQGKEWDEAYEYLAGGNAQLLGQLNYRFVNGPIPWDKK